MSERPPTRQQAPQLFAHGADALAMGDRAAAVHFLGLAVRADRRNVAYRLKLADALAAAGDHGGAVRELTVAMRLEPGSEPIARALCAALMSPGVPPAGDLDRDGLIAALAHSTIDRELIARPAIARLLAEGTLRTALERARADGALQVARELVVKATSALLQDALLLALVGGAINCNPELEGLLIALRRVIAVELPAARLGDRALIRLVLAIARQARANEYVWVETAEESALAAECLLPEDAAPGAVETRRALLIGAMYRPYHEIVPNCRADALTGTLQPEELRRAVASDIAEHAEETAIMAALPPIGTITDETSLAVAEQYVENPYPRWTSLGLGVTPSEYRRTLTQFFTLGTLAFMDRPFEVLIAGCGTGQQAIAAALAYGPNARVIALDLSRASLAYAERMAKKLGVGNIDFRQADILELATRQDFAARFKVIECTGVLHHMADPFAGWRALLKAMAPGGIMCVALYSALARKRLTALRGEPGYPGPGCSVDALRAWRQSLLPRPEPGLLEFIRARDFHTTSGFRDLTLHVNEHCLSLDEIERFMAEAGLTFRGFHDTRAFQRLRQTFPEETWPGRLSNWRQLEEAEPMLFAEMYQLWCEPSPQNGAN